MPSAGETEPRASGGAGRRRSVPPLAMVGLLVVSACGSGGGSDASGTSEPPTTVVAEVTTSLPLDALATSTTMSSSGGPSGPITGYGDLSGEDYVLIDWFRMSRLVVECVRDHGFPVRLVPPGDGWSFMDVPPGQNALASRYADACVAGLNIPPYQEASLEQRELFYEYYLVLRECLIAEGFGVSEPPSKDYFVENYLTDPWSPYLGLGLGPGWETIQYTCPQTPAGGWGSWEPGDPVGPLPPLPDEE